MQDEMRMERKQERLFLLIVVLFWFAQYVYIPYQTMYLTAIGTASSAVGVIVGAYGISQMLLRLPVGVCADRIGRHKKFIISGALASGFASLFRCVYCNSFGFLMGNLFSGFASAMWISYMVFYTEKYTSEGQQKATGRIVLFNNVGMLLGFVISTLCYGQMGMKTICLFSMISGGMAGLLSCFLKEPSVKKEALNVRELLDVCTNKRLLMFSLIALIQQGIQLTTTMSFTNTIIREYGASDGMVGISSVIYMISAVGFAALASSKFCERKGPKFWIPTVLLVVAIYCILVPAAGSAERIMMLQVLPGMSTGILFSYATSEAMKDVPRIKKSTAMGFFQAVYAVGMTVFPVFTGKIAGVSGMQQAYLVLAIIALVGSAGAVCYYRLGGNA